MVDEITRPEVRSVTLVTGATGAIGRAIAEQIAVPPGHEVVLVCRDAVKAATTVEAIQRRTGNPNVRYELGDLSRRASIIALAARWRGPVHATRNGQVLRAPA